MSFEEDVNSIALELEQLFSELLPDRDFSVGTALNDLIIKPLSTAFASRQDALEELRNSFSLALLTANPDATDEAVDNLLSNYGVERRQGQVATGLVNIYTTSTQNTFIQEQQVITCGSIQIQPSFAYVGYVGEVAPVDTDFVKYVRMRDLGEGLYVFTISARTLEPTTETIATGQTCTIEGDSDITRVEIAATFQGGSLPESNQDLLERAQLGLNANVVTGRDNIRKLLDNLEEVTVYSSQVFGFGDALQVRDSGSAAGVSTGGHIDVYVSTAPTPTLARATLTAYRTADPSVWKFRVPEDTYAGAYGVTSILYQDNILEGLYNHILTHTSDPNGPVIRDAFDARYSKYQLLDIEFSLLEVEDNLNEIEIEADIYYMQGIDQLQEYFNQPSIRSRAFDTLIRAAIAVDITVRVEIELPTNVTADEDVLRTNISTAINSLSVGTPALQVSDVTDAINETVQEGRTRMPVHLHAKVYLPDGKTAHATDLSNISVERGQGISYENASFYCLPSGVEVILTRINE